MNISRISKAIAEVRSDPKFRDADDVRNIDVDILLPPKASETISRMAQTVVALTLRCFKGQVRIYNLSSNSLLRSFLESEAKKMGTPERLDFTPHERGPWCLAIGYQEAGVISADASGWTARINGTFTERIPAAPPAICFAAACAVAKLFNRSIFLADKHSSEAWDFCLLRLLGGEQTPIKMEHVDLGNIGLLGAGGIGSAVGYVLSISSWSGKLDVIDFDSFQEPNLETCILADVTSVNRPLRKAFALANSLKAHGIDAVERHCRVEPGESILREKWDAFVCAVDNPETRLILDDIDARILLNAGLGSSKQDVGWVLWTQHRKTDRKLSSIYRASSTEAAASGYVPDEFREECSRKSYHGVSLALPFSGLVAGSLLVASLYRNAIGHRTECSFLQIDLLGKQQRMNLQ